MSAKELALDVIKHLPDDATMLDLTEELYAAAVREGLDSLDRGEGIPHAEVKRQRHSPDRLACQSESRSVHSRLFQ